VLDAGLLCVTYPAPLTQSPPSPPPSSFSLLFVFLFHLYSTQTHSPAFPSSQNNRTTKDVPQKTHSLPISSKHGTSLPCRHAARALVSFLPILTSSGPNRDICCSPVMVGLVELSSKCRSTVPQDAGLARSSGQRFLIPRLSSSKPN